MNKQKQEMHKTLVSIPPYDLRQMEAVTSYINDRYTSQLTLKELIQVACMSGTKLKTLFKLYHNCTITEYIRNKRMERAENLLAQTMLNVGEISQYVGYTSPSRFSELFRRRSGMQPLKYRSACQKCGGSHNETA